MISRKLIRTDLNLLVALQILLEERNVTRAAERLSVSQPGNSIRGEMVERFERAGAREKQLAHMAHVEHPNAATNALVLLDQPVVLHRHRPAREIDHLGPVLDVPLVQRCALRIRFRDGNDALLFGCSALLEHAPR